MKAEGSHLAGYIKATSFEICGVHVTRVSLNGTGYGVRVPPVVLDSPPTMVIHRAAIVPRGRAEVDEKGMQCSVGAESCFPSPNCAVLRGNVNQ